MFCQEKTLRHEKFKQINTLTSAACWRQYSALPPMKDGTLGFRRVSHFKRTLHLIVTFIRRARGCLSSLIQIVKFSERPCIVPHEVMCLNGSHSGSLVVRRSEDQIFRTPLLQCLCCLSIAITPPCSDIQH